MPHDDDSTEAAEAGISEVPPAGARLAAWGILAVTEASVAVAGWALVACGLPWQLLLTSYAVTNGWMAATFAPFGALVASAGPTGGWLAVLRVRAVLRIVGGWYLTGDVAGHRGRPEPLEFHARMARGVHLDPGGSGVLPAHRAAVP